MEKQLSMKSDSAQIKILEGENVLFKISKSDNKISGTDLYEHIFKDISLKENITININQDGLCKEDMTIFHRFKDLIDLICKKINDSIEQNEMK